MRSDRRKSPPAKKRSLLLIVAFIIIVASFVGGLQRLFHQADIVRPLPSPIDLSLLTVSAIDVGQGDAIFVHFPDGRSMLVDAGDGEHGEVVVHYLEERQVKRLDLLVATHPHKDHIGGMQAVLRAFPVHEVWDSGYNHGSKTQEEFLRTVKRNAIRFRTPMSGYTRSMGQVQIEVLAPQGLITGTDSDANNNSLVLRISYGQVSFLLTGDMEETERRGIASWPLSTVLKVAHHGSRNGTDTDFLRQVDPRIALISRGFENEYGHPHAETLAALRALGARVTDSAVDGTVTIATNGKTVSVPLETAKQSHAKASVPPPVRLIGNTRSMVFHRLTCDALPSKRNRAALADRKEALARGYHACRRCNP